jgi:hypothetical protein
MVTPPHQYACLSGQENRFFSTGRESAGQQGDAQNVSILFFLSDCVQFLKDIHKTRCSAAKDDLFN